MGRVPGRLTGARAYLRRARAPVGTLVAGALGGFIVATLAGQFLTGAPIFGGSGEPPEARAYIVGLLQRDAETLLALVPRRDIVSRAQQLQAGREAQSAAPDYTVTSLTYLGGGSYGAAGVHVYVVGIHRADGLEGLLPLILTLIDGKIVRIE
jgi:hypothetical protein